MSDPTPRRSPDGLRTVTPPAPGSDSPADELPGHGELILIVEDEPEFRELVELWVGRHGWRTAVGRPTARRSCAGSTRRCRRSCSSTSTCRASTAGR